MQVSSLKRYTNLSIATINWTEDFNYEHNGEAKQPLASVKINDTPLTESTDNANEGDYKVEYKNNVNAATGHSTKEYIAKVCGLSEKDAQNYAIDDATTSHNWNIEQADINAASVTLAQTVFAFDGREKTPTIALRQAVP